MARHPLRPLLLLGLLCVAVVVAGCGSGVPNGVARTVRDGSGTATTAETGQELFDTNGCGGCHTLAAAGAHGAVGPDLNTLKPSYAAVVHQVTHGGGVMPAFEGTLNPAEISRLAHYVATAAREG